MTRQQQWAFGLMVGAQFADYETSRRMNFGDIGQHGNNRGAFYEKNSILGKRPDDGNIMLFKVGVVSVLWGFGELFPEHRTTIYSIGIVSGVSTAINNKIRYDKYR